MAIKVQNLANNKPNNYNNLNTIIKQTNTLGDRYNTLLESYKSKATSAEKNYQTGMGLASVAGGIAGLLTGGTDFAGVAGGLVSGIINYFVSNNYYKRMEEADKISQKASDTQNAQINLGKYAESLAERDTTIEDAMDVVTQSLNTMVGSYGSEFVNNLCNYYLAQSGVSETEYSILTGNYNTFQDSNIIEQGGFGLSDLTKDTERNIFLSNYKNLSEESLGTFRNLLVNNILSSETEGGIALRTYQQELKDFMASYDFEVGNLTTEIKQAFPGQSQEQRESNISIESSLGEASAKRATSGLRGGTATANEKLVSLQKTMEDVKFAANSNILLARLKLQAEQLMSNASSQAYKYQQNLKLAEQKSITSSIQSLNALAMSTKKAEKQANTYLQSADEYRKELQKYSEEYTADEDTIWDLVN